jgi:hypothetical protein
VKVGDLVVLSAKGKKIKHNHHFHHGFGIVLEVFTRKDYYDLGIQWFCTGRDAHNRRSWFKRYEIKKLKPDKKCP